MSALGGVDDGSEHALIMAENEAHRVQRVLQLRASRPSRMYCLNCDEEIPLARRNAVAGCLYCVHCQDKCDNDIPRTRMLQWLL